MVQNCFYTPFQQTGSNEWSANFQGVDVKFSDLHIRSDGRLYGRLIYVSNGIILSGGDSYNQRDFGAEVTVCSQSSQSIAVSRNTSFINTVPAPTVISGVSLNGVLANTFGITDLFEVDDELEVVIIHTSPTQTTMVTTTKYRKVTLTSCMSSKMLVGKLVAQGVVYNLTTGAYTFTGLGIASICYPDPMVGFI